MIYQKSGPALHFSPARHFFGFLFIFLTVFSFSFENFLVFKLIQSKAIQITFFPKDGLIQDKIAQILF